MARAEKSTKASADRSKDFLAGYRAARSEDQREFKGLDGSRLRRRREALGLNQTKLGYIAGMNAAEISRLENGARQPGAVALSKLAWALHTSADYLLGLTVDDTASGR